MCSKLNRMEVWLGFIILQLLFGEGVSECLQDLERTAPYTGKVTVTNNGFTCQAWATQSPHKHTITARDRSLRGAKNYCRELEGEVGRPWCYTTHPHVRWDYCTFSICTEYQKECIHELHSPTGSITPPDMNNDGLYDLNIDCLWVVVAPDDNVVRYTIHFYETEDYGLDDFLIFEKADPADQRYYSGSNFSPIEGETLSNMMYVMFYSDYSMNYRGFNITYRHIEALPKECGGIIKDYSGWIFSPDIDNDGRYDFNINCSWVVESEEFGIFVFEVWYFDIDSSTDGCEGDYLKVMDKVKNELKFYACGNNSDMVSMTVPSTNAMLVVFQSDKVGNGRGFNISYHYQFNGTVCLDGLKDYSGTVDVTNSGYDCQAWSDQTPHRHSYTPDNEYVGNSCRDAGSRGRPWCFTTNPDIRWGYCTLRICDISYECGGSLDYLVGPFIFPDSDFGNNFDCLWSITGTDNEVIRFHLYLVISENMRDCGSNMYYPLRLFEKGAASIVVFCDGPGNNSVSGETRSNMLYIQYYSDISVERAGFAIMFDKLKAFDKNCTETFTESAGIITAPDVDGDMYYDYNLDCHWKIKGPENAIISFEITNIDIELSEYCQNDHISV